MKKKKLKKHGKARQQKINDLIARLERTRPQTGIDELLNELERRTRGRERPPGEWQEPAAPKDVARAATETEWGLERIVFTPCGQKISASIFSRRHDEVGVVNPDKVSRLELLHAFMREELDWNERQARDIGLSIRGRIASAPNDTEDDAELPKIVRRQARYAATAELLRWALTSAIVKREACGRTNEI